MPGLSRNQVIVARIAEHNPGALYERNKGMASMKPSDLHDYAATPTAGLPKKKKETPYRMGLKP